MIIRIHDWKFSKIQKNSHAQPKFEHMTTIDTCETIDCVLEQNHRKIKNPGNSVSIVKYCYR